jgi:hypothetical protein
MDETDDAESPTTGLLTGKPVARAVAEERKRAVADKARGVKNMGIKAATSETGQRMGSALKRGVKSGAKKGLKKEVMTGGASGGMVLAASIATGAGKKTTKEAAKIAGEKGGAAIAGNDKAMRVVSRVVDTARRVPKPLKPVEKWMGKYLKGEGQDAAEDHLGKSGAKQAKGLAKVAENAGKGVVMSRRYHRMPPESKLAGKALYRAEGGKTQRIRPDADET